MSDGGPASPCSEPDGDCAGGTRYYQGMTLRDWFAGRALAAVVSAYVEANGRGIGADHVLFNCSCIAYKFADAMLAEREKAK